MDALFLTRRCACVSMWDQFSFHFSQRDSASTRQPFLQPTMVTTKSYYVLGAQGLRIILKPSSSSLYWYTWIFGRSPLRTTLLDLIWSWYFLVSENDLRDKCRFYLVSLWDLKRSQHGPVWLQICAFVAKANLSENMNKIQCRCRFKAAGSV